MRAGRPAQRQPTAVAPTTASAATASAPARSGGSGGRAAGTSPGGGDGWAQGTGGAGWSGEKAAGAGRAASTPRGCVPAHRAGEGRRSLPTPSGDPEWGCPGCLASASSAGTRQGARRAGLGRHDPRGGPVSDAPRVLVVVASRHGATAEIAAALARGLGGGAAGRGVGLSAVAVPAEQRPEPGSYDAVLLGSAVYAGRWLDPARQ